MSSTRPLAQRLLFPALPLNAQLPPLVSSPELTPELYDFIALALRAFVLPWWSKISRYDKQLLPEITHILTAVIHNLDNRIHNLQLSQLLLQDVPIVITQHYRDYRNAKRKLGSSYASGGAASLPQLFHQFQPHMAVSVDGRLDTEYFRHLIDHILKVCLPPQDYQPEAERIIVREIILNVFLNDIIPKITQPWFIHKALLDLLQLQDISESQSPSPPPPGSFSFHNLLVLLLSGIQTISGACLALIHAYKHTLNTIKRVNQFHLDSSASLSNPYINYASPPLTMFAEIFTFHDRAASTILFAAIHISTRFFTPFFDQLLPYLLETCLSSTFFLSTIRIAKRTLFPNGYPGPPPLEPTPEEQAEIHARLTAWRPNNVLAAQLLPFILGPSPTLTLEAALDPLNSAPCNVHLVLFLLDCVLAALFPELVVADNTEEVESEKGVESDSRG